MDISEFTKELFPYCAIRTKPRHNINFFLLAHMAYRLAKLSILILERIIKKISYERGDYESVDEKSLSKDMSQN